MEDLDKSLEEIKRIDDEMGSFGDKKVSFSDEILSHHERGQQPVENRLVSSVLFFPDLDGVLTEV